MKKILLLSAVVVFISLFSACEKDDEQFTTTKQQYEQGSPNQQVFISKDEYDIPEDGGGN